MMLKLFFTCNECAVYPVEYYKLEGIRHSSLAGLAPL